MSKRKWTNEQFILAVETSLSYAEVIRKHCHALTDNYRGKNIKQVA